MRFHFTKHAKEKFLRMKKSGFPLTKSDIINILNHPVRTEDRADDTSIASAIYGESHIIRVVYRQESDIIIIITFYPGRRKAYDL